MNQATSSNMSNNGGSDLTLNPFTRFLMTYYNYGGVQTSSLITNGLGVDPNNNTAHQQFIQSDQSAGQSFQHDQYLLTPYMFYQMHVYYLQYFISPITNPVALARHRPIIIDGLNVAYTHGCHNTFSAAGIFLCVLHFIKQGFHSVKVMMPQHFRGSEGSGNNLVIRSMMDCGFIYFTPSRMIQGTRMTCYSDRIILDYAISCGGVVVSNDNFRDLYIYQKYQEIIENRHIMFMFIDDEIIFPEDQYGMHYPHLNFTNILNFPA